MTRADLGRKYLVCAVLAALMACVMSLQAGPGEDDERPNGPNNIQPVRSRHRVFKNFESEGLAIRFDEAVSALKKKRKLLSQCDVFKALLKVMKDACNNKASFSLSQDIAAGVGSKQGIHWYKRRCCTPRHKEHRDGCLQCLDDVVRQCRVHSCTMNNDGTGPARWHEELRKNRPCDCVDDAFKSACGNDDDYCCNGKRQLGRKKGDSCKPIPAEKPEIDNAS